MLDDTNSCWWYEQDGQQAGPVTAAAVARLVSQGRLGPAHRVWRDGMSGWEVLGSVAELAPALEVARPPAPPPLGGPPPYPPSSFGRSHGPPGGGPGTGYGPGAGAAGASPPSALEEISPGAVVILSIVTLGIYGLVKFHQTGKGYEALAGRASSFARDFWLCIGLGVAGGLMFHTPFVWGPLSLASLVFGVLALGEALALRDEAVRRAGVSPELTSAGTHKVLYVAGMVLWPLVVGLVLLVIQAWKWFSDWNAIGAALARRSTPATTVPAAR